MLDSSNLARIDRGIGQAFDVEFRVWSKYHEYHSPEAQPYFDYWGERAGETGKGYYSFDLGAWHIVALNSNIAALAYWEGSAEEFTGCYDRSWGRHQDRSYPVPGNHEYDSPEARPYFDYWGERAGEMGRASRL